jgi:hypothetical protein
MPTAYYVSAVAGGRTLGKETAHVHAVKHDDPYDGELLGYSSCLAYS